MCVSRHQAGRYKTALELAEKANKIEIEQLGARPEKMAGIYLMSAVVMDEVSKESSLCLSFDGKTS